MTKFERPGDLNRLQPSESIEIEKPLRIALLGYRSAPHVGGQGIYVHYLSKSLVDLGHKVDVISGPPYPELDPRVNLIKLPSLDLFAAKHHHFWALRPRHLLSYTDFFEWWSMLTGGFAEPYTFSRRAHKYLQAHQDDYDIVHDNQCLGYGLLDIQALGLPVVVTIHHPITRDLTLALKSAKRWYHKLLIKRWHSFIGMQKKVVRQLKHLVTVSQVSRSDIADAFDCSESSIDIVHCGTDTNLFAPRSGVARKRNLLMTTASADQPLKGLRFLLKAIASLKNEFPDIELLVIGKLKESGPTEKLIHRLGIEDCVRFESGISTERLIENYARASVAVSPSLYEGFGLPAAEAMSCAVPLVSSDGGALPEVVGDAGLIVKAGDSDALAEAIKRLLSNATLREELGAKGRARIIERFSWAEAARQLSELYHRVLAYEDH